MKKITITLTRYKEPNWLLHQTLEGLSKQKGIRAEVLFLDQFENLETKNYCNFISTDLIKFRYVLIKPISLSYARNYAIKHCKTPLLLFIDTDAIPEKNWAQILSSSLLKEKVAIVGGKIIPKWHKKPLLLSKSSIVSEQYSMLDMGVKEIEVKKVVGANFSLNIERISEKQLYFDEELGRKEGVLLGGEEVDLCERVARTGMRVLYNGQAIVYHQVLPERIKYSWIFRRIYYSGFSRALRGGKPEPTTKKRNFWDYITLPIILPAYIFGYIRGKRK